MKTFEKLFEIHLLALKAQQVTDQRYAELVAGIESGILQLDTNYQGWAITSIWAAKPVAWRPRPMYEYALVLPSPIVDKPAAAPITSETVGDYASAYMEGKDLFNQFDAEYHAVIAAYLRGELDPACKVEKEAGPFYTLPDSQIRVYEVKVVK